MPETIDRDSQSRFTSGRSGNPAGRPRGATPGKTLERLIAAEGAELFVRAFERAKHDDAVLAAVVTLIAAAEQSTALAGVLSASVSHGQKD